MIKKLLLPSLVLGLALVLSFSTQLNCYGRMALGIPQKVQLDGYTLATLSCGSQEPAIIIEPGLDQSKEVYYGIQKLLFPYARVITYDHAGIGESSPSGNPRTLPFYVDELKALLEHEKLEPPYILVGHSLGGHIVRYFAHLYPDEVAGLVLLDGPHEDWFRHIRANWTIEEQKEYFRWWNPKVTSADQVNLLERLEYDHNNELIRGIGIPPDIPVLMFTGTNIRHFSKDPATREQDHDAWVKLQRSLLDGVDDAEQIVDPEFGHWPHLEKPDEVAEKIVEFVNDVRMAS